MSSQLALYPVNGKLITPAHNPCKRPGSMSSPLRLSWPLLSQPRYTMRDDRLRISADLVINNSNVALWRGSDTDVKVRITLIDWVRPSVVQSNMHLLHSEFSAHCCRINETPQLSSVGRNNTTIPFSSEPCHCVILLGCTFRVVLKLLFILKPNTFDLKPLVSS